MQTVASNTYEQENLNELYNLLTSTKTKPIWECVNEFVAFFQIHEEIPEKPTWWNKLVDFPIRNYVYHIILILDQYSKLLYDHNPHLEFYSKRETFSFSMLRKVPEVLIEPASLQVKFCFEKGIEYFDSFLLNLLF
jgi:hypothetical protein